MYVSSLTGIIEYRSWASAEIEEKQGTQQLSLYFGEGAGSRGHQDCIKVEPECYLVVRWQIRLAVSIPGFRPELPEIKPIQRK